MSKLALPPLGQMDSATQAAFRAVASWANSITQNVSDVAADQQRKITVVDKKVVTVTQASTEIATEVAKAVASQIVAARSGDILRTVLENSGTNPPIEMNSPVLFQAGTKSGARRYLVWVGAGGIAGGYEQTGVRTETFSVSAADGSFFFGAEDAGNPSDVAHKQIVFDATSGVITFGSSIIIRRSSGALMSLESVASGSADALAALANKIDKNASYVLGASSEFKTSGYAGGNGMNFTNNGIVAKSGGVNTFVIASDGTATFSGSLSAATGSFAGSLSAATGSFAGDVSTSGSIIASGNVTSSSYTASIIGNSVLYDGVVGFSATGVGVRGVGTLMGTTGVLGSALNATAVGVKGVNSFGGYALYADGRSNLVGNVDVTGTITATSNITAYSDRRVKTNISRIPDALEKVKALLGCTFDRTDIELRQMGLIAQDVREVAPEAVVEDAKGRLSVSYGALVGLLVEAIKELDARVV